MSRHSVIANHWYVSIERPSEWRPNSSRAPAPRLSKSFQTENEAKQFAREMLSKGLQAMAGTMNPHLPRRLIVSLEIERWIDEGKYALTALILAPVGAHDPRHGATVHFRIWHFSDVPGRPEDVRSRGKTGVRRETGKE